MRRKNILFSKIENQRGVSRPGEGSPVFILTLTMVAVVLVLAPECLAAPYTLSVTASNGSVTVTPNKAQYNEGEAVELIPRPDTGYCFTGWTGDARGKRLVLNLTMDSNKTITANFGTWQPPIGIPVPTFGIHETYRMYDVPGNRNPALTYTQNAEGGYYTHYIDNTDPNATDGSTPGITDYTDFANKGTLDKPRNTVPWILPEGAVVEIHGGPYTYASSGGVIIFTGGGTVNKPIFIRGYDSVNKPKFTHRLYVSIVGMETEYIIIENLDFDGVTQYAPIAVWIIAPSNHIACRNIEIHGVEAASVGFVVITEEAYLDTPTNNIVLYNSSIHDLGDMETSTDTDFYGVGISGYTHNIWIVDNQIYNTQGGVIVNAGTTYDPNIIANLHHIYVGRNEIHDALQAGVWTKQSMDVIFSQNEIYHMLVSPNDDGGSIGTSCAMGYQYGPFRTWYLFNNIHDLQMGSAILGVTTDIGDDIYFIGNLIQDVNGAGLSLYRKLAGKVHIIGNTIYDTKSGISLLQMTDGVNLYNNIVSEIIDPNYHLNLMYNMGALVSEIGNSLFYQAGDTGNIQWGDYNLYTIPQLQQATGKFAGCIEADPQFTDPENNDFRLQPTSPAKAAALSSGAVADVYDRFETLYGIDIRKDIEGTALTDPWDIGAYEYTSSSSDNNAPVLSSIGAKSVDENALLSFSVSATDADSDTITYSATNLPTGATFSSQAFSWTPGYAQTGSYSVTFTASDGTDSDSEVVTITVGNTNRAPVLAAIGSKSANENASLSFSISATDADSDTITYSATNLPTGATFSSGSFSWTPGYTQAGSYDVTFTASDGTDTDSEIVTITVTVSNVNRTPVLAAIGSKSANEGSVLSFSVSATDPDIDDSITYSAATLPTGSAFASQTFTWTPGYAQAGTHEVTFTASDGTAEDSETVTITVNNTNRAPVLDAIADKSANENTLLTFGISATDPDGDPVSYSATGLPSGATFASQTFSWTPSSSQAGSSHEVTFIADDGQLNDSQIVTITVTDTLAPSVTNLSPAAGSIQAPLNSLIILHVTDAGKGVNAGTVTITLDGSTIYSGNTSNYVSATGNCRRIGTAADYTYAYQSSQTFDFDQAITVAVNATDLAGNVMIQQSYSFRTEMRSFGQNKSVDSTVEGLDKAATATAADSSGNIWAVWHAGAAGSRDIYIARLAAGFTSFGVAKQITTDSADQHNPALALGTDNKLYVVWQDNRNGDWDIYGSTSMNGTTWSAQRRITDSNDNQINPAIAIDSQSTNRAYVVWQDDRSGNEDIYVAVSANAFLTNLVTRITSNTSDQTTPAIAVDSSNTAYVVWTDARNATTDIYGASAGAWTNVPIVNNSANQSNPAIAVESTGSILHFAWVDQAAGNSDIYYASSNGLPGSPLTGTNLIDDDTPGAEQLSPAIAVTGSAGSNLKVFACWLDERNASGSTGDTDIYLVQTNAGSGANVFISDGTANSNQTEPAMGTDQYGYPYIVWTDDRGANTEIYFAASTFMQSSALASQLITAASGGTVGTDPNAITGVDDVSIVLPAGACPYDVTIAITKIENPHDHALPGMKGYDFGPSGIVFNTPVTITIPLRCGYDVGAYLSYWYDSRTGALSRQGITDVEVIVITPTLHAMRFKTTHFTPFYVAAAAAAAGGGGGGGGGGGCSVSPAGQGSILEMLVPCLGLAVVMAILKLRDARNRNTRNISGGKS